jgi:DNA-binding NtrC family response regulator
MFTKSITIIDDDTDLLNLFRKALQMSGYNVSSFSDPCLAYQHIKQHWTEYSLLIINDKMPKINALAIIKHANNI